MSQRVYNIQIIRNNSPVYIYKNCGYLGCSLPNNSKYSIQLTNNNSKPADAYLRIDGKKMGAYRIIPNESIVISRPSRRRKDLTFLRQTSEMESAGLFNAGNPNLGQIDVIFRSGEIYDPEETDINYEYNKQVYRLEDYEVVEEYMNKYKRMENLKNENEHLFLEQEPEPECDPYEECWSSIKNDEVCSVEINENNGYTAYSSVNNSKYKTFQALDYDGSFKKMVLQIEIEKFESL
jgi:hypothetical protein